MTNSIAAMWGVDNNVAVLKLSGEWRFEKGPLLKYLIEEILPTVKVANMVIDLTDVTLLDSTILGLIAQIGLTFKQQSQQTAHLIATRTEINQVLLSMAFDTLFKLSSRPLLPYPKLFKLERRQIEADSLEECVLNSHKTLTSLSESNKKAFADLMAVLENKNNNPPLKKGVGSRSETGGFKDL